MTQIEEAAIKWADDTYGSGETCIQNGFKAGAEFTQRWIPVEEDLPNNFERVLTKTKSNQFFVSYVRNINEWYYNNDIGVITHWRPIEYN